ncbi:MAG: hypothetical protein ACKVS5_12510 [Parvularculaceae bacterium]
MTSRFMIAAAAIAGVLAACGKSDTGIETLSPAAQAVSDEPNPAGAPAPVGDLLPPGFPKPSADFAGVYQMGAAGQSIDVKMAGSGGRQRIEFPPGRGGAAGSVGGPASPFAQVMVSENSGEKILMWPEGDGAPKIAAMMRRSDVGALAGSFGVDAEAAARGKKTGDDTVAGERCAVWSIAQSAAAEAPGDACVTPDGIVLRAISGGQTVMLAKSIDRGRQDASLFAPPADYEIADMGECMRIGAEAMELARGGKVPDLGKMEKCRVLGEKMGAMFRQ